MKDIQLEPVVLTDGINKVKLTVSPLSDKTLLYGDIIMTSVFCRRFYVSGKASDNSAAVCCKQITHIDENNVYTPVSVEAAVNTTRTQNIRVAKSVVVRQREEKVPEIQGLHILKRGERISIDRYADSPMRVYIGYRALFKDIEIDPYAFMLNSDGITSCDDDFVFFGNTDTSCGALYFNGDKSIDVDLRNVPDHIQSISFVYSIYQPDNKDNFSKVLDPFISVVQNDIELVRYTASELFAETTIIFMEMYRYKSGWKLNTVGQGYREGLKKLCANYGLIVS
jgi:stress response protein SCP2